MSAQAAAVSVRSIDAPMAPALLLGTLTVILLLLSVASLAVGRAPLDVGAAIAAWTRGESTLATLVLIELRLPRTLLAVLVGASLGLAGAALQGLLRNPLAEPGIIGVSSCAAFGAVIAFYSGASFAAPLALPVAGIAGALVAVVLLYALAGREASTLTLILAGVAINGFAAAATALALNLAPNPFAITEIVFWMMGSLADRSLSHLYLAAPLMIFGWALLLTSGRALDALTLGEDTAASLGVRLNRLRFMLVLGTALAVGSGVAVTGAVGFVGLVAPHLLRPLVAHQPSRLLSASALAGAVLVLAADIAIRAITIGPELKLGVVTALIGAPFFLMLVLRLRRETI
ncbi:MAG TPA: iron ABC transporter permease [Burkholderiaceae bacterium]|jgi:iron complex transport system permease protein|nr:iron ABC transporter permease [Burkholderiaceae bacterium]